MPPSDRPWPRPQLRTFACEPTLAAWVSLIWRNCWRRSIDPYGTNRRTSTATALRYQTRRAPALLRAAVREAIGHHYAHCPAFARWYRKAGDKSRRGNRGSGPSAVSSGVNLQAVAARICRRAGCGSGTQIQRDLVADAQPGSAGPDYARPPDADTRRDAERPHGTRAAALRGAWTPPRPGV